MHYYLKLKRQKFGALERPDLSNYGHVARKTDWNSERNAIGTATGRTASAKTATATANNLAKRRAKFEE